MLSNLQKQLVSDNLNLIHHTIRTYYPDIKAGTSEYEDCFSQGSEGLCNAAMSYKNDKVAFSTYAVTCIKNCIYDYLRKNNAYNNNVVGDEEVLLQKECKLNDNDEMIHSRLLDELISIDNATNQQKKGFGIIRLIYDGFSSKEICAKLNMTESEYKTSLHRARKALKNRKMSFGF